MKGESPPASPVETLFHAAQLLSSLSSITIDPSVHYLFLFLRQRSSSTVDDPSSRPSSYPPKENRLSFLGFCPINHLISEIHKLFAKIYHNFIERPTHFHQTDGYDVSGNWIHWSENIIDRCARLIQEKPTGPHSPGALHFDNISSHPHYDEYHEIDSSELDAVRLFPWKYLVKALFHVSVRSHLHCAVGNPKLKI